MGGLSFLASSACGHNVAARRRIAPASRSVCSVERHEQVHSSQLNVCPHTPEPFACLPYTEDCLTASAYGQMSPDADRSLDQSESGKEAIEVATLFSSRLGKSAKMIPTTPTPTTMTPITLFLYGATSSSRSFSGR